MIITNALKEKLLELFAKKDCEAIQVGLIERSCGGQSVDFSLVTLEDGDRIIEVNGIKVVISEEDEEAFEHLIFDYEDEGVVLSFEEGYEPHHCCDDECCEDDDCCCHHEA